MIPMMPALLRDDNGRELRFITDDMEARRILRAARVLATLTPKQRPGFRTVSTVFRYTETHAGDRFCGSSWWCLGELHYDHPAPEDNGYSVTMLRADPGHFSAEEAAAWFTDQQAATTEPGTPVVSEWRDLSPLVHPIPE